MLFTVCIPAYNRAGLIGRTIQSVLDQSFQDFEIIVVDDGSIDNTKEVVQGFSDKRIEYIYKTNGGKHTALNVGLENTKGDLFIVLDSDDTLFPDCLESMRKIWNDIVSKRKDLCGILGRCTENDQIIGIPFTPDPLEMSYITFHYGKNGGKYKDCCECIRTDIIKNFRWPVDCNTHFVPEAYVMDQIGIKYKLICTNRAFKSVEYLSDGITLNKSSFRKKNYIGYLYDIVSKLDEVMPETNEIILKYKIVLWWKYWNLVAMDIENKGPRCKKETILGKMIRLCLPILNKVKGN